MAKRLLLHLEQGRGDVIQFIRFVPMLIERGAQVIVYCRDELTCLLRNVTGVTRMTVGAETVAFDMFSPLLSLPLYLGTRLETIPANVPYVHAEPELAQAWAGRLAADRAEMRVGLVWAGSSTHANDKNRSLALAQLAPLWRAPGITFFSLQKGDAAVQAAHPPAGINLIDHTAELTDFADTAGLISQLELVITVDTAVAHLAGAMGKKVWVLLPFVPDWRLAARAGRQPVVSDDAAISAEGEGRLGRGDGAGGGGIAEHERFRSQRSLRITSGIVRVPMKVCLFTRASTSPTNGSRRERATARARIPIRVNRALVNTPRTQIRALAVARSRREPFMRDLAPVGSAGGRGCGIVRRKPGQINCGPRNASARRTLPVSA